METNTQAPVWLTREQLSQRIGIPVSTLNQWASRGRGPRYAKFGGRQVRYSLADVIEWEQQSLTGGAA